MLIFQLSDDVDDVKINKMAERLLLTGRQLEKLLRDDLPIRQLITSSANSQQDENTDDGEYKSSRLCRGRIGEKRY